VIVKQLAVGGADDNFSYVLADEISLEGMVLDPCGDTRIILKSIEEGNIRVKYIVNTHGHSDHIEGNEAVVQATKALTLCHKLDASSARPDIMLKDGDIYKLGELAVKIIHTPGHTPGGICLWVNEVLFTGDTLFVGYCGRTDSPGGSSEALYESLFHKIGEFPDETRIYPGHNYGKRPVSTVGYEKSTNPYYQCGSREEFVELRARGV